MKNKLLLISVLMLLFCVAYIVALRKCKFCGADAREIKKKLDFI